MEESRERGTFIQGRWHLISGDSPEGEIPEHRVDLVFHDEPDGLRGAVLSRADDRQLPLHTVTFDGVELRLQMLANPIPRRAESPYLVMRVTGDHFEGAWDALGAESCRLKLVRAPAQGGGS